jgi:protein-S-isoprenylcysteine O-methyltransferase Ste14
MADFMLIKTLAVAWILFALFFAVIGGRKSSRDEKFSGNLMTATLCLFPAAITFAERNSPAGDGAYVWGVPVLNAVGFGLIALGVAFHGLGMATLRHQWTSSVAVSDQPKLITHGVYRWLRNPIYAGILLVLLGFGLTFSNAMALAFLAAHFGAEYDAYRRRTKRLVPLVF